MVSREDKARVCEMYANGVKKKTIASTLCISINSVQGIITRDYLGKVYSRTPVHIILKSKV